MNRTNKLAKILSDDDELKKNKKKDVEENDVDRDAVSKIVGRMKGKYMEEGVLRDTFADMDEEQTRVRMLIRGEQQRIGIGTSPQELSLYSNPFVRFMGKFYLLLESPLSALVGTIKRSRGQKLEGDLLSAQMNYSPEQYISLVLSATVFSELITLLLFSLLIVAGVVSPIFALPMALIVPIVVFYVIFSVPSGRAMKIATKVDRELPFALRHMSIEIRAGVGVYKSMESLAKSGYGPLSDGFRWVLQQIEKGVPTEEALLAWSERSRSESLNRAISHLVRALRTGGNLSEVMITIADDVSFEKRAKISDFAEKLNLISLFLMMFTVILPVMISILTSIASSPAISSYMGMFSVFTTDMLKIVYFIVVPAIVTLFIYYIKESDPS